MATFVVSFLHTIFEFLAFKHDETYFHEAAIMTEPCP